MEFNCRRCDHSWPHRFVSMGYGPILKKHGVVFIHPGDSGMQEVCMEGIIKVKNPVGDREASWLKAIDHFAECMLWYADRGVTVFARRLTNCRTCDN